MLLTTQLGILQEKITVPERYATFSFKIGNTSIAFISSFLRNPEKKKKIISQKYRQAQLLHLSNILKSIYLWNTFSMLYYKN